MKNCDIKFIDGYFSIDEMLAHLERFKSQVYTDLYFNELVMYEEEMDEPIEPEQEASNASNSVIEPINTDYIH